MEACRDLAPAWYISTTPDQARPLHVVCSSGNGQKKQKKRTDTGARPLPHQCLSCLHDCSRLGQGQVVELLLQPPEREGSSLLHSPKT